MRKVLLISTLLLLFAGCNKYCDDCLETTPKFILVKDASGNNLLFGDHALYNPDSVVMRSSDQQIISTWKYEEAGTIQFTLEEEYSEYIFYLTDSIVDTISFDLSERESTSCCGMVTFSSRTFINGEEAENSDIINIIK